MEDQNKRAEAWTHEETVLLIELWGDERVQNELENTPRRNLEVFRRICTDMKDSILDFSRSPQDYTELEDEDDSHTSDVSRQPESQLPGPPRPETPAPSRPGSSGMQASRGTRMKTTKRKKQDPAEIMQQFLEIEKTSEKQFWEFEEKRLKLDTEQEEKRRREEADREDRQRNADRQFMANLMQMQMNLMRMQQAPPLANNLSHHYQPHYTEKEQAPSPPINLSHQYQPHYTEKEQVPPPTINLSHQYQPHYTEKEQAPPPPPQINAIPLNQQHYTEMQPMQASNMGNYQTSDVLKNVRNQMEF
ncbi:radixin-like [Mytilus trossulus]|uniref:radixin-like n=1 Tax=Mytilus trossulus TaxID=6551 RepID=UPI003003AB64